MQRTGLSALENVSAGIGLDFEELPGSTSLKIRLHAGERVLELHGRERYLYLLLSLAKARQLDDQRGVAPPAAGWLHRAELARQLDCSEEELRLCMLQLRRELVRGAMIDAIGLVERLANTKLLRVASRTIAIRPAGDCEQLHST